MSSNTKHPQASRRKLLGAIGSVTVAGAGSLVPRAARAAPKTLRIMQWNHFVPAFDEWFNKVFVKSWGERNDTVVSVTNVPMTALDVRAAADIKRRDGHDICMFLSPPASYEDHVIDHKDIYVECERRFGKPLEIAIKSTYNPVTKKFFGFSDGYVPDPVNYRQDLWAETGIVPTTWDQIRTGGRRIKETRGIPVGIGMSDELDSSMATRSIMAAFGASEQTADGRPALKSNATIEALKYARALYRETMTDEIFSWDASSNNRQMLAGKGSLTLNAISITRTGENEKIPISDKIMILPPAAGPAGQIGLMHLMNAYVVWNFSKNIDGAKKFLIDLAAESRQAFLASQFYNFPTFPQLVPDLDKLVSNDSKAKPMDKYNIFRDASTWTVNVGYPGYANAAIDEIFKLWTLPRMFADVAAGRLSPEDATAKYSAEVTAVFAKWRERKKV